MENKEMLVNEIVDKVVERIEPIILKANRNEGINENHNKVYEELIKAMRKSYKDGEVSELGYKGVGIRYDGIGIDNNGLGDSVITLFRDVDSEDIEVATVILEGGKKYKVTNTSDYWPELIEL